MCDDPEEAPRRLPGKGVRPEASRLVVAVLVGSGVALLVGGFVAAFYTWEGTTGLIRAGLPPRAASSLWSLQVGLMFAGGVSFLVPWRMET